jgi:hypothetical protein
VAYDQSERSFPKDPPIVLLAATAWASAEVRSASLDTGVLRTEEFFAGEGAFAQQLAHTAAQFEGVDAVQLRVDGEEIVDAVPSVELNNSRG